MLNLESRVYKWKKNPSQYLSVPRTKKNKIRWEGLAEGRDQMSMTCPYNKTVKYHKVA